ncbi:MAG: RusA family crossover junction endodeoxyribonuclease [Planctomycetes bacterium]|nr:RusA family crossover junction endodeoxyribonuclease [Planctomycetota bacterium]
MGSSENQRSRPERISAADFSAMTGGKSPPPGRQAPRKPRVNHRRWTARIEGDQTPFRLRLPFLPPSVNKLFTTVRDPQTGVIKRVLTQQARRIRRLVLAMIDRELNPAALYELHIDLYMSCFTRKGLVRKVDVSNRVKFIEDCVCTALGIDDSHIFRVVLTKRDAPQEFTLIEIRPLAAEDRDAA